MKNALTLIFLTVFASAFGQTKDTIERDYYKSLLDSFRFENYMVDEIYAGKIAKLDLKYYSNPKDIKDKILASYNQVTKPNFAGHYIIFSWGCGSPCEMWAIVDATNGQTIATFNTTSWGAEFRVNSYLLIHNPPSNDIYDKTQRETFGEPEFNLFIENKLVVLKSKK